DLAVLYPERRAQLLHDAEDGAMTWVTDKPEPHANGLRFLVAAGSTKIMPKLKAWADPQVPMPLVGAQPPIPPAWEIVQSALRYYGMTKDKQAWGVLERQLTRQPAHHFDLTMEGLKQGGIAVLGMTMRALGYGASDGFAEWGDNKAAPL